MLYADEKLFLALAEKAISNARRPYRELGPDMPAPSEWELRTYAIVSPFINPFPMQARRTADNLDAHLAGSRIVLALAAYKDRHGSYPETLDELRDRLGWEIPEDPFSGQDFIYRREGKGFLLYSIGRNLEDDGGNEPPEGSRDEGDIVWRIER